jgi:SAM-dependent methyltransferase
MSVSAEATFPNAKTRNAANGAACRDAQRALDKARIAKTWEQYYEDRGYELWGFSPSPTARILAQVILDSNPRRSERIEIVDWGCGYGRDSLYFLELGFDVIGIDVSEKAVALARRAYKQRQASGIPLLGSASFHTGNLHSVFKSRTGQTVRVFFSNRVLHLLSEVDFRKATCDAMSMEEGAYFCVSARSLDDFNSELMEWIPGKERELARYKDPARRGHHITFVTKDRLLRAVGNDLEDMHYRNVTEPERVGSRDTHLLILLGRKRGRSPLVLSSALLGGMQKCGAAAEFQDNLAVPPDNDVGQ